MRTKILSNSTGRRRKRKRISLQPTLSGGLENNTTTGDNHEDEFSWDKNESISCIHESPISCSGTLKNGQVNEEKMEQVLPKVSPGQPSSARKLVEDSVNGSMSLYEIIREYTNRKEGHMPEELVAFLMHHLIDLVQNLGYETLCTRSLIFHVQNNVWRCSPSNEEQSDDRENKNLISIAIELLLGIYCNVDDTDIMIPFVTCNKYLQRNWSGVFSSLMESDFASANEKLGEVNKAKTHLHTLFLSKDREEEESQQEKEYYENMLTIFRNHVKSIRNGEVNKEQQQTHVAGDGAVQAVHSDKSHQKDSEGLTNKMTKSTIDDHANDDLISSRECNEKTLSEALDHVPEKASELLSFDSQESYKQSPQDYVSMSAELEVHMRCNEEIIDNILDDTFGSRSHEQNDKPKAMVSFVRHGRVIIPLYDSDEDKSQS